MGEVDIKPTFDEFWWGRQLQQCFGENQERKSVGDSFESCFVIMRLAVFGWRCKTNGSSGKIE